MNWTDFLTSEIDKAFETTSKLVDKVDPANLDWKPASGNNWMTMGQLLKHICNACGSGCKGVVTGDWGLPPGKTFADLKPEEMFPPADVLPAVPSVQDAKTLLAEDRLLALEMVRAAGEDNLNHKQVALPWAPGELSPLGRHVFFMIQHLERHKDQLFYYLKLQGQPVNTVDLWG